MARSARHHVVTLVVEGSGLFELSVATEFFGTDPEVGQPWYRFSLVTEKPGMVPLGPGLNMTIDRGLDGLRTAGTVIVPGWPRNRVASPELLAAIRAAHRRGARMMSFCTGAFLLAEAGILDGRIVTTHWNAADRFQQRFPDVKIDPGVLYVDDGDVLTSAGSASAIDLAIHVIRNDYGADVAKSVAREMVVAPHRQGGQAQFVSAPHVEVPDAQSIGVTLDWIVANLADDLSLAAMARHANLSTRQFSRRFVESTGTTPHQWLLQQRILHAQSLLESTALPVEDVAHRSGFGSAAAMRPHFVRIVTTTPTEYRRCFGGACDVAS